MELNGYHPDQFIAVLLLVFLSSVYYATASGITSSNDGSHYALTRAIAENGRFSLSPFDPYAEGNDVAVRDGVFYSDRPPGTALAATLFYEAGGALLPPPSLLPSRHDPENPRLAYVMALPALAGAGTIALLYFFMRRLQINRAAAVTTCLMVGLGTIHWKYSSVLYSHALSALLVVASLVLALRLDRRRASSWWYLLLGLILGYAVLVEYSNGLLVVIVGVFVLASIRPYTPRRLLTTMGPFIAGGLVSALFLAVYNTINFGSLFTLSYAYAINYPWAGDLRTTFNFPLLAGLRGLLLWGTGDGWCDGTCYNQGFLLLSPVLALAVPGVWLYWRRARREAVLTMLAFAVYLLLFARHRTFHGFTGDGRYLAPFLVLLAIPLGFTVEEWLLARGKRPIGMMLTGFLLFGFFFLSLRNILYHIGFSYNYTLDLNQLDPLIASPQNWHYGISAIFRNVANLLLLWAIEGVSLLLFMVGARLSRRRAVNDQAS